MFLDKCFSRLGAHVQMLLLCLTISMYALQAQDIAATLYHNTTAHYNALYIAREQHSVIETTLREQETPNYEEILPIYLRYDTTHTAPLQPQIEDCIKKTSLVLQYHVDSKWSDEAYLLLGKAWHYQHEPKEAIKAFQYLSLKGKKPEMRMAARIALLRTYVQDSLLAEAQQVLNYISRNPPQAGENRLQYLLAIAYLAQRRGQITALIRYIHHALPLTQGDKYLQTRLHFILGQSYEALGDDAKAHLYYSQCAKRLLPYAFYLEAQLRSWVSQPAASPKMRKKLHKHFAKELREQKNKSLRHHILFHWARMEQKHEQLSQAKQYYLASAALNHDHPLLQGRAYEAVADMYYADERLLQAAPYYDSAAQVLPDYARGYAALVSRSEIFQRLAKHYHNQQRADSLLRLSTLPADSLAALLTAIQAKEKATLIAKKKAAAAAIQKQQQVRRQAPPISADISSDGTWYFYNQSQLAAGGRDFEKTWGQRPLSDYWRLSSRASSDFLDNVGNVSQQDNDPAAVDTADATASPIDTTAISIERLLADIPQDEESKQKTEQQLQDAYYGVGNIYYFELEEKQKGIDTFVEMVHRFRQSVYRARLLFLLAKEDAVPFSQRDGFAALLRQEYADSIYTKLLNNPNYLIEQAAAVRELQARYQEAYAAYTIRDYGAARDILQQALQSQQLPNSFTDNALLLDILLDARLGIHHLYQYRLQGFLQDFPTSELQQEAEDLLEGARQVQVRKAYSSTPRYELRMGAPHVLLWTAPHRQIADSLHAWLPAAMHEVGLLLPARPEIILLDKNRWVVFLPNFESGQAAMSFFRAYQDTGLSTKITEEFPNTAAHGLAVSTNNLLTLFAAKDTDTYTTFFQQHYLLQVNK